MANASPIGPDEVEELKERSFPNEVLEAFNELIVRDFSNDTATVRQNDVVKLMIDKGLKREEIFAKHWLDVETAYRRKGWTVTYDKPAYNETYEPTFLFTRPRK